MGTSMTVPDSLRQRMAHKFAVENERATANKLTLQKGKEIHDKITKIPLQCQAMDQAISKLKLLPQTAISQENQPQMRAIGTEVRKIQLDVLEKDQIEVKTVCDADNSHKQSNLHSIWQSLTEETKYHFKNADQKRKKSYSCVAKAQNQVTNKETNQNNHCKYSNNDKNLSQIYSDRANQFLLSINSKFGLKVQACPTKQVAKIESNLNSKDNVRPIIKKKILLPDVQIVNSIKQKRKLKYVFMDQEVKMKDDVNWRVTA